MYFQAGDTLLKEIKNIPEDAEILDTDVYYQGQNHKHRLKGNFKLHKKDSDIFIESFGCEAFHDEHKTILLPNGIFSLSIVKEYDHLLEESRSVID